MAYLCPMTEHLNASYWESLWQNAETRWDLQSVSPPLAAYIDQIPMEKRDLTVLIPGCGNGYEAAYLLENGFTHVTMLDIAPTAVETVRQRYQDRAPAPHLVCGDFFEHDDRYDLILEQTFFCALHPSMREAYALKMKQLLRPGGTLAGVLFDREFPPGPPFGGSRSEYQQLFAPHFFIQTLAPCYNSAAPRAGTEVFIILKAVPPGSNSGNR